MALRRHVHSIVFCIVAVAADTALAASIKVDPYEQLISLRQYGKAAALVAQSAQSGNPLSQYRYAVMLRLGLGVKRDESQARTWLRSSANAGNIKAAKLLKSLSTVTTSDRLEIKSTVSARSARVAELSRVSAKVPGKPSWIALVAARNFTGFVAPTGAHPSHQDEPGGETALIAAARSGNENVAEQLLTDGADVKAIDKRGLTALHWAAANRNPQIFKLLVAAGGDVQKANKSGQTPTLIAARACNPDILAIAATQISHSKHTLNAQNTPAHEIAANCADPAPYARYLNASAVSSRDERGRTPLWYAASRGSIAVVKYLLAQKADSSAQDSDGVSPLHLAAARGNAELLKLLLNSGADPELQDKRGNTALLLAADRGTPACVALLLPRTSDIDLKNEDGDTALMLAVKAGKPEVVEQIAGAGGSFTSRNLSRQTPEQIAARLHLRRQSASLN